MGFPLEYGSIICAPTVSGVTAVYGTTVCGTTIVRAPTIYGSTLVCGATICGTSCSSSALHCGSCGIFTVCSTAPTIRASTCLCSAAICASGNITGSTLCASSNICTATGNIVAGTGLIQGATVCGSTCVRGLNISGTTAVRAGACVCAPTVCASTSMIGATVCGFNCVKSPAGCFTNVSGITTVCGGGCVRSPIVCGSTCMVAPRFISTQTTGTAPFSIASTTLNTNLNADLLDGLHASEISGTTTYASNGLNKQGDYIRLGGGLTGNTGVYLCTYDLTIASSVSNPTSQFKFAPSQTWNIVVDNYASPTCCSYFNVNATDAYLLHYVGSCTRGFYISNSCSIIYGQEVKICDLPAQTSETHVIYIGTDGLLATGVTSSSGGDVTGTTTGVAANEIPVYQDTSGKLICTSNATIASGILGITTVNASTLVCAPTVCGTTIARAPTVFGSTLVCGATVCGTTIARSPTIYGSTLVCGATVCGTTCVASPKGCYSTGVTGATVCGTSCVSTPNLISSSAILNVCPNGGSGCVLFYGPIVSGQSIVYAGTCFEATTVCGASLVCGGTVRAGTVCGTTVCGTTCVASPKGCYSTGVTGGTVCTTGCVYSNCFVTGSAFRTFSASTDYTLITRLGTNPALYTQISGSDGIIASFRYACVAANGGSLALEVRPNCVYSPNPIISNCCVRSPIISGITCVKTSVLCATGNVYAGLFSIRSNVPYINLDGGRLIFSGDTDTSRDTIYWQQGTACPWKQYVTATNDLLWCRNDCSGSYIFCNAPVCAKNCLNTPILHLTSVSGTGGLTNALFNNAGCLVSGATSSGDVSWGTANDNYVVIGSSGGSANIQSSGALTFVPSTASLTLNGNVNNSNASVTIMGNTTCDASICYLDYLGTVYIGGYDNNVGFKIEKGSTYTTTPAIFIGETNGNVAIKAVCDVSTHALVVGGSMRATASICATNCVCAGTRIYGTCVVAANCSLAGTCFCGQTLHLTSVSGTGGLTNAMFNNLGCLVSGATIVTIFGTTVNGVTTYVDTNELCVQPNLIFDGTTLTISACTTTNNVSAACFIANENLDSGACCTHALRLKAKGTGSGRYYGLFVDNNATVAETQGRNYGAYVQSGNRTAGYNIGIWGRIVGSNCGVGILADSSGYTDAGTPAGTWALYAYGDSLFCGLTCVCGKPFISSVCVQSPTIYGSTITCTPFVCASAAVTTPLVIQGKDGSSSIGGNVNIFGGDANGNTFSGGTIYLCAGTAGGGTGDDGGNVIICAGSGYDPGGVHIHGGAGYGGCNVYLYYCGDYLKFNTCATGAYVTGCLYSSSNVCAGGCICSATAVCAASCLRSAFVCSTGNIGVASNAFIAGVTISSVLYSYTGEHLCLGTCAGSNVYIRPDSIGSTTYQTIFSSTAACFSTDIHFTDGGSRTICVAQATDQGAGDHLYLCAGTADDYCTAVAYAGGNIYAYGGRGSSETLTAGNGGAAVVCGGTGGASTNCNCGGTGGNVYICGGAGGAGFSCVGFPGCVHLDGSIIRFYVNGVQQAYMTSTLNCFQSATYSPTCFYSPVICATTAVRTAYVCSTNGMYISSVTGYKLCVPSGCGCAVDWTATSDCRLKKNIIPISNALSIVNCLCGVCYDFCIDNSPNIGLIAQDVLKVEPRLVTCGEPDEMHKEKYGIDDISYGLKYDKFAGLFVEAIKELKEQNEQLQKRVDCLENIIKEKNE